MNYSYMSNFSLRDAAIWAGGGALYGLGYTAAKKGLRNPNKELTPEEQEEFKQETLANAVGGVTQGVGGYLLTKALMRR